MSYKIEKKEITVYKIRNGSGLIGWADITVDGKGSQCRVTVSSDYGNWSYYWGACGNDYKEFIISLDIHYVAGKTDNDRFFDLNETLKGLKSEIINDRKGYELTGEEARELYDSINELEDCSDLNLFQECYRFSILSEYQSYPDLSFKVHPRFINFWNGAWKAFTDQLLTELE